MEPSNMLVSKKENTSSVPFLKLVDGYFRLKSTDKNPDAEKRINKEGNEVYELLFSSIEGKIDRMKMVETSYGRQLQIRFTNKNEEVILTIPEESTFFIKFCLKIDNINFEKDVKISTWLYNGSSIIEIMQEKKKIENYFTDEKPNGIPIFNGAKFSGNLWKKFKAERLIFLNHNIEKYLSV